MKLYKNINSSNTALLIIDVTNFGAHKNCEITKWNITYSRIRKMVPRLKKFIGKYRKEISDSIIFVNLVPWRKKFLPDNINELYTDPSASYYSKKNNGFGEQFYLISPKKGDIIITKNNYDAFTSLELDKLLKKKKIRYLVITGIFGDGCVLATICGGLAKGYNFVILKDLIETTDVEIRQELLKRLKQFTWPMMYGKTLTSENFLKAWRKK